MKKKLSALYNPYLDTLGGGEKHILSILKVLEEQNYKIDIFWKTNLQKKIKERFNIHFKDKITFLPDDIKNLSWVEKLLIFKKYDLLFYVTDGSYFFSTAKKNFIFTMVPDKNLYNMNLINKLKTLNNHFIANSYYTKNWLERFGIKTQVIYPYINDDFIDIKINNIKKDKIILSVGRFFNYLHSKRQEEMIYLFKKLKQNNDLYKDFILILAGSLKEEDKGYFVSLKNLIGNDRKIVLKPNITYNELFDLYKRSNIYWHFTGLGVDEKQNPERVEHLGISPLESMASGAIPFCYKSGGPKEIIQDGKNGYLFESKKELISKMQLVLKNNALYQTIQNNGKQYVIENFSYQIFKKRVIEVIKS